MNSIIIKQMILLNLKHIPKIDRIIARYFVIISNNVQE